MINFIFNKNMKYFLSFIIIYFNLNCNINYESIDRERIIINKNQLEVKTDYEWTIIGAGVAGIIAIAILLDLGIQAENIYWIDPLFNVGRIGEYYQNVTGNTPNKFWVNFLKASPTIEKITEIDIKYIESLNQEEFNTLGLIAKPMQKVTDFLKNIIPHSIGYTNYLEFFDTIWHIGSGTTIKTSRNIILATGSHPTISESNKYGDIIPLDYALDPNILKHMVKKEDIIAVFGGSHSAVLILKYLSSMHIKQIYNFYKHPLLYAIDMGDWTLNATNGLKGETALWARTVLELNPPKNLIRLKNTEENRQEYLSYCNKIIYAIGYQKNPLPLIKEDGVLQNEISFDPQTGIIGPRLFGIGLAFPGYYIDQFGNKEQLIGLNSFMQYALQVMPEWIKSNINESRANLLRMLNQLNIFEKILSITML
jgi:thioredoxin reductase